jgi:Endonuclease NucS
MQTLVDYGSVMLERVMEEAIAGCPDLFIEPGLTLVRRQVVINGRRPDVLFCDGLSRHLLVEIQSGRLDEDHLQRHFYYYYDYRAKYPSTYPRLMFIANQIVIRHKEFLDEHGYEYKEILQGEFERKANACLERREEPQKQIEVVTSPGVLEPFTYELLYEIEKQPMSYSYKMLLLEFMAEDADETGRVPTRRLAERFQEFFVRRSIDGKAVENPNRPGELVKRTIPEWEGVIRSMPVRKLTEAFVIDEVTKIRWADRIWRNWSPEWKREVRDASLDRLRRYYDRNAGGY